MSNALHPDDYKVIRQDVMRLHFRKMCTVTHFLFVTGENVMRLVCLSEKCTHSLFVCHRTRYETAFEKKVHFHPHPYGHSARCDKTAFQEKYPVTHKLLVKGQDVMMMLPFGQMSNVKAHHLFVIVQDVTALQKNIHCHDSPTDGHI
jgi:hypothetical protein